MSPPPATAAKSVADASQHVHPKSDIEIAQAARMRPIADVAREKLGIAAENLEPYGHYKAKVSLDYIKRLQDRPNGKLILVSAITPTPAGEGKTTTTVGLTDALNHIGKKAMLCIREPSLGPCFGVKGGAAGGGYAQVVPMEDINLHFTGDFHAITAAHNLLSALIDNHIYWGNALGLDSRRVAWRRVVDMNDRALREIVCSLGGVANGYPREAAKDRNRRRRGGRPRGSVSYYASGLSHRLSPRSGPTAPSPTWAYVRRSSRALRALRFQANAEIGSERAFG